MQLYFNILYALIALSIVIVIYVILYEHYARRHGLTKKPVELLHVDNYKGPLTTSKQVNESIQQKGDRS